MSGQTPDPWAQERRHDIVMHWVTEHRGFGLTVAELRQAYPERPHKGAADHHGSWSGILSLMHRDGFLERLKDQREGSDIYVLPEFVRDRETWIQGRPPKEIEMLLAYWFEPEFEHESRPRSRKYPARFVTEIGEAWERHCKPGSHLEYRIRNQRKATSQG